MLTRLMDRARRSGPCLSRRQPVRYPGWGPDTDALEAGLFSADQFYLVLGDGEELGKEATQLGIGLTLHRWRGEAHPEMIARDLADGVGTGPGLHLEAQDQILPFPSVPAG